MRIAVISDIHANADAFWAVLEDIRRQAVAEIICLGDAIGYGAEPQPVVERLRSEGIVSVIGNHDLAAVEPHYLKWFNPTARQSLEHSISQLSTSSVEHLRTFPRAIVRHGCRFVHGFPPASPILYQFAIRARRITTVLREANEPVCFTGHTHELEIITWDGSTWSRAPLEKGVIQLDPTRKYIVNIGSVGQPRDGTSHAKYVVWDLEKRRLELRFVDYDVEAAVEKILAAGLPPAHAYRLR